MIRLHALVKNPCDKYAVLLRLVKDRVAAFFEPEQARIQMITWPPQRWVSREHDCALFQSLQVFISLLSPPFRFGMEFDICQIIDGKRSVPHCTNHQLAFLRSAAL